MPDRPGDMDERDVDARFASIVARWDGPVPDADDTPADDGDPTAPRRRARRADAGHRRSTPRPRTPTEADAA